MLVTRAYTYFIRELAVVFLVVFVILLVLSLGGRFTGYLQEAASGRISADGLWYLMWLRIPDFVQLVVPFSLLVSVLLTVGRLHADQEFVVLVMAHVGPVRVVLWIMTFAVPLAALVAYLSLVVSPGAKSTFIDEMINQKVLSEFDVVIPGEFRTYSDGTRVTYVDDVDRDQKEILGLFLNESDGKKKSTVVAEKARYHIDRISGTKFMELSTGRRYVGEPGTHRYQLIEFDRLKQRVETGGSSVVGHDPSAMATNQLNFDHPNEAIEWHWRVALPIVTLMMGYCGLAIAKVRPRTGRFGRVLPGLCVFIVYYVLILLAQKQQLENPSLLILGLWPIHLLFLLFGTYFTRRSWLPT